MRNTADIINSPEGIRQKGKGLAIAGIIITALEFIVYFGAFFFELLIALCGGVQKPMQ